MKNQSPTTYYLLLTYSDIFRRTRPTLNDFRAHLSKLPKTSVVHACSIINILLRTEIGSSEPINFSMHHGLVTAYFESEIASQILYCVHQTPPRVVFHRQQLLFVIKEALQYASDDSTLKMANSALGEVLLIANDHMHFDIIDEGADTLNKFAMIASTFLQLKEGVASNPVHKILRSYQMTKSATGPSGSSQSFDLPKLFELGTGLELLDFYALVLAAVSRFSSFDPTKYLADPFACTLDEKWFSSTKATSESIEAFFSQIAATPDEFSDRFRRSAGPNDYTAFRDKPFLRTSLKLDLIDFWMLAEKFESGPFWAAASAVEPTRRAEFHSFWGQLFERYIADVFTSSADGKHNRVHVSPRFRRTGEEFADVVVVCGQDVVVVETKGATFPANAKYQGDHSALREVLESKLVASEDRPQAVKQLARNIERVFGQAREAVDLADLSFVRTIFPLIVMRDDLAGVPGVNAFLDIRFRELVNRKGLRTAVAPLTCMSSEAIESISAYLNDTSFADLLGAHIRGNHRGAARYQTLPFFMAPNSILARKGDRAVPNHFLNLDDLVRLCADRLGLHVNVQQLLQGP